ncbi:MAG: thioesterase [Acidimicrobiia bacterium]|nr:MAG: thioesterase [Acidimicrobiia bacterium]
MAHTTGLVVRFSDLDPYNHVNHARFLSYFESARIELLEEMGLGMNEMLAMGFQIVLVDLAARFHAPARLGDRIEVTTVVAEVRRATSRWEQIARRGEELLVELSVTAAFTDLEGRPRRPPELFREKAARFSPAS